MEKGDPPSPPDAFARVSFVAGGKKFIWKTHVVKDTCNPEWNKTQTFEFMDVPTLGMPLHFRVQVYDSDAHEEADAEDGIIGPEALGFVDIEFPYRNGGLLDGEVELNLPPLPDGVERPHPAKLKFEYKIKYNDNKEAFDCMEKLKQLGIGDEDPEAVVDDPVYEGASILSLKPVSVTGLHGADDEEKKAAYCKISWMYGEEEKVWQSAVGAHAEDGVSVNFEDEAKFEFDWKDAMIPKQFKVEFFAEGDVSLGHHSINFPDNTETVEFRDKELSDHSRGDAGAPKFNLDLNFILGSTETVEAERTDAQKMQDEQDMDEQAKSEKSEKVEENNNDANEPPKDE